MATDVQKPRERPTQAVILAGGRGTRLEHLTADRPKPMVEFQGKPFLEHTVVMLREQGFTRVLMLLGYLPEVIQDHFGDGSRWGVEISYSVTEPDDLTSHRVKVAADLIDPCFLLLYCDNYWPMQFDRMWSRFVASGLPALVTIYGNTDKYSRDSVRVGDDGRVAVFDRTRKTPGLQGVEISYAILDKSVLSLLPEHQVLFEDVYPTLTERGQLLAYVTDHRYYSVGSLARLPLTETFFARRPTVLLDRDGVLNRRPPRAEYVRTRAEFHWLPGALEALRLLAEADYRVIVISNQPGIARQMMTEADLTDLHGWMQEQVTAAGGRIDGIYYCPHGWDDGCSCRKPKPGMLFQAQRDFHLDLTRTTFIGDDERDGEAAEAAGAPFEMVTEDRSLADIVRQLLENRMAGVA
jgi:histidinol-phosphate phosphatase family protein